MNLTDLDILGSVAHEKARQNLERLVESIEEKLGKIEVEKAQECEPGACKKGDVIDIRFKSRKGPGAKKSE